MGVVVHAYNTSSSGSVGRKTTVQGHHWAKSAILKMKKMTKVKKDWGVSQVVQHLPKQQKSLSSNPNTTRK
jgi:hypothetical protein